MIVDSLQNQHVLPPASVVEALAADVLAGVTVATVRGAPGVARSAVLRATGVRLREHGLSVVLLDGAASAPTSVVEAVLTVAGSGGAAPAQVCADDLEGLLARAMGLPGMKDVVLVVDQTEQAPAEVFQCFNALIRLARNSMSKLRLVLFGDDVPWPELRRVGQELCSTYVLMNRGLPAMPRVELAGRLARYPGWAAAAGLSIMVGCAGTVVLLHHPGDGPPGAGLVMSGQPQVPVPVPDVPAVSLDPSTPGLQPVLAPRAVASAPPPRVSLPAPSPAELVSLPQVLPPPSLPTPSLPVPSLPAPVLLLPALPPPAPRPPVPPTPVLPGPAIAEVVSRPELPPLASVGAAREHGLVLMVRPGDTLAAMYDRLYRGKPMPSFTEVLAMNPAPVRPGTLVMFPEPPGGWNPDGRRPP